MKKVHCSAFILGWYSVTPEEIAFYIAKKCKGQHILDAFCGAGGNSIQVFFFLSPFL